MARYGNSHSGKRSWRESEHDIDGNLRHDYLLWVLRYDPPTGIFYRQRHYRCKVRDGTVAGWRTPQGYLRMGVGPRFYLAHRLAWFYMTKTWPPEEIDHINMVKDDNRWVNLRLASRAMNIGNRRVIRDGLKGVFQRPSGRWGAQVGGGKNRILLGTFDTEEEAHEAYQKAACEYFGQFARFE